MTRHARLINALRAEIDNGRTVPLLVLRLPEFARVAWSDGKRAARDLERRTAAAFRESATHIVRDEDRHFHAPGSDWFAVAMLAPARGGARLDPRAALERIAASMSLRTGRLMETGWWPVCASTEIDDVDATVERALERGARERERFEFLATVGHELRTPLTSIRGYLETLLDGGADAVTQRRFLETARRETLRLGRIIDGMLEFSLLDLGAVGAGGASTCVAQEVAAALDALGPIARERGVALAADVDAGARARIDPDAYTHAIVNLIENAIKYTRPGGRVVVKGTSEPPFVDLVVDDDGPGIPAGERDAVFAMRSRGDSVDAPGSGIGLAIVKTIVERARGSIEIDDSPIGGARFRMRLPEAESETLLS